MMKMKSFDKLLQGIQIGQSFVEALCSVFSKMDRLQILLLTRDENALAFSSDSLHLQIL